MTQSEPLSDRELRVLEAVIQTYIETAEPAGSQALAKRFDLGVSPATIRNTMSELERKGYLTHPHTSAGRMPTDQAYRLYVNSLTGRGVQPNSATRHALAAEFSSSATGTEDILRRAAQVLSVLTMELGVAVRPALDNLVLERLDLVRISSERLLLVFELRSGVVRTIFVQIPGSIPEAGIADVVRILNERLAGHTLREIRTSLTSRLRDAARDENRELLNIFVEEGEDIFDLTTPEHLVLGSAALLADQPEFAASNSRMRGLLDLTEQHDLLRVALQARRERGLHISIGAENLDPRLTDFTLVTSSYQSGDLQGVIGVLGPTRMPYRKIIGLVEHTSRLVEGLLDE
jgi:heat-inducible transcriptional repressor